MNGFPRGQAARRVGPILSAAPQVARRRAALSLTWRGGGAGIGGEPCPSHPRKPRTCAMAEDSAELLREMASLLRQLVDERRQANAALAETARTMGRDRPEFEKRQEEHQ